ncbi:Maltase-glucoamylase, intestinal, partial [Armadillidium vulgare]
MKFILGVLLLSVVANAQENVVPIICPVPGNPDPTTVTEDTCNTYTACEYTSGVCHMKQNNESGYLLASEPVVSTTGIQLSLKKANSANTLFGTDIEQDSSQSRYEVPIQRNLPDTPGTDPAFEITTATAVDEPFYLEVRRKSTGTVVFRTEGPLTFEDQFIQVTSSLSSPYFYGVGEICHSSLLRSFDERITNVLFARDRPPYPGSQDNLYGSHPYYINIEDDEGNTHSNIQQTPAVTIRTIGGILDFHLFLGPNPDDVTVQYTEFIGRPFLPPYWSLGFQLSRYGYNSLDNYKVIHDRMIAAEIPWDPAIAIDFDTYPPSQRGKDSD